MLEVTLFEDNRLFFGNAFFGIPLSAISQTQKNLAGNSSLEWYCSVVLLTGLRVFKVGQRILAAPIASLWA